MFVWSEATTITCKAGTGLMNVLALPDAKHLAQVHADSFRMLDNVDPGLINPSHYWRDVPSKSHESPPKGDTPLNQPGVV